MARVLLIEPDKLLAKSITGFLKNHHRVDWQVNPQAALDRVDARTPDVIVLDFMLASRSGIEFLYELKSYPEWQNIPVLAYSSLPLDEVQSALGSFDHLKVTDYLYKPTATLEQLLNHIEDALQPAAA